MIPDREVWACARQVLETHGDRAPMFVAERLGALALAGDAAGVATWTRIAAAASELGGYDVATRSEH